MLVLITPMGGAPTLATITSVHGTDPGFGQPGGGLDPDYGQPVGPNRPGHDLPWAPGHPSGGFPVGPGHPSAGFPVAPGHPSTPIFIPPGTTLPAPVPPDVAVDVGKDGYYAVWVPALRQWGYAPVSTTKPVPPEAAAPKPA